MAGSNYLMQQLERWIAPWKRRILCMIGKCIISAVDDSGGIQTVQIQFLSGKTISNLDRIQEFGFTSVPPLNSEGSVSFLGGNQQHGIVVATDNSQFRLKGLPSGSVAIYNESGDFVKITHSKIEVHADNIEIGDGSGFKKLINEEFKSLFNNHGHDYVAGGSPAVTGKPVSGLAPATVSPPTPITSTHQTSKTKAE